MLLLFEFPTEQMSYATIFPDLIMKAIYYESGLAEYLLSLLYALNDQLRILILKNLLSYFLSESFINLVS